MGKVAKNLGRLAKKLVKGDLKGAIKAGTKGTGLSGLLKKKKPKDVDTGEEVVDDTPAGEQLSEESRVERENALQALQLEELRRRRNKRRQGVTENPSGLVGGVGDQRGLIGL